MPTSSREEIKVGEGLTTFVLLLLLFFSLTGSIATADWTDGLGVLTWAALGGITFGWGLAKIRRVRGLFAHLVMLLLSVPATTILIASLLPSALTFEEKLIVLQDRVVRWFFKVAAGGSGTDNLIFVIQLALLTWLLAYSAAWFVYRRHQVWGALLPSGLAILINLYYAAPQASLYFGLYLLCALLLLVRMNLRAMERDWRQAAIGYASDISFDFMWYGALFALVLLVGVWVFPASAPNSGWLAILDPLQEPWQHFEEQFTRAFSTLNAVARASPTAFFGTVLTMGGPVTLGQRPVMDIRADNGRYWRAMVYDKYGGGTWVSTHLDPLNLNANDVRLDTWAGYLRVQVTQTVTIYLNDQNILFAQSQPVRFNIPTEARVGADKSSDMSPLDLTLARARRPLRESETYTVVSALSAADEDSLRADSTNYSEWIVANYLQLPDNLPARVRDKAKTITAEFSNPYDQATALEKYLRANIKYDEKVSAPPVGVDGVDYLLFERPAGYCNYYASAMAVLARAVGIPARVASGYTLGEYENGVFHIVEANAHSWVEIYFPGYGWVEFEPTPNKPEIERPKKLQTALDNPDIGDSAAEQRRRQERANRADEMDNGGFGTASEYARLFWSDPRDVVLMFAGVIAIVGFFIIPYKRQQAKTRFKEKIETVRQNLNRVLTTQFNSEADRTINRLREGVAPYFRFVRGEKERLGSVEQSLANASDELTRLQSRVGTVFGKSK